MIEFRSLAEDIIDIRKDGEGIGVIVCANTNNPHLASDDYLDLSIEELEQVLNKMKEQNERARNSGTSSC